MNVNVGFLIAQLINIIILFTPFLLIGGLIWLIWFFKNNSPRDTTELKQLRKQVGELQHENGRLQGELDALRRQLK